MTPERFRQLEELYHAVREAAAGERAALLADADADLRRELESLFAQRTNDGFLERLAILDAPQLPEDATVTSVTTGACLGPYRIESKLGEGGMGEVFRAVDTRLDRAVAIKTTRELFSDRFEREARAISALNHPNICTLHDVGPNYLVMELVEGPTLQERIRRGPVPLAEALDIARQVAEAIEAAHEQGIVHRDLKPANIKVRRDGMVKVLDFGLAKRQEAFPKGAGNASALTATGQIVGTVAYMAPEQARGEQVDRRVDTWAFGVTLYEMLTGERPFQGHHAAEILAAVLKEEPDLTKAPEGLRTLLGACLEKDPNKRLRDVGDAMRMLHRAGAASEREKPGTVSRGQRKKPRGPAAASRRTAAVASSYWSASQSAGRRGATWSGTVLGGSTVASHPRISPDGHLLAFRAVIEGITQLAVMRPDSSSWTILTRDRTNGALADLAWSRDGSRIYFDREWGPGHIYSIGALGGEPRLVLKNAWLPEPLPDGSLIAQRHSPEGREKLLRFWPETGRIQELPATVRFNDSPNVRAFPDGREIVVFGLPADGSGASRFFVLNLETLEVRMLDSDAAPAGSLSEPVAVSQDGRYALIQRRRNDTWETIALPRSGVGPPQTLIPVPGVAAPISQDVAPDGSIYMDHSELSRSVLLIDPSGSIRAEIPTPQLPDKGDQTVIALPGNAVIFDARRRGRSDLFLARPGAEPQLLLNGPESAGLPGALLGTDRLAFLAGVPDQPHIAIASLRDGSIIERFPADAGKVTALTAPADGQTIYYASDGTIWAQPVSGGEPQKMGRGYFVAAEPSGRSLYLVRAGADGYGLFRMPAAGGEAERVSLPPDVNLTTLPLSASAVDGAGRILLPVNIVDVFYYRAAIYDPVGNTTTIVPVPPGAIVMNSGWTPDGDIAMRISRWSSSLWRYQIALPSGGSK